MILEREKKQLLSMMDMKEENCLEHIEDFPVKLASLMRRLIERAPYDFLMKRFAPEKDIVSHPTEQSDTKQDDNTNAADNLPKSREPLSTKQTHLASDIHRVEPLHIKTALELPVTAMMPARRGFKSSTTRPGSQAMEDTCGRERRQGVVPAPTTLNWRLRGIPGKSEITTRSGLSLAKGPGVKIGMLAATDRRPLANHVIIGPGKTFMKRHWG